MAIITISRQYGSGGDEIAERLCECLGYGLFDKRLLLNAAAETGLSEQEIIDYSEENHKVRSFIDRLFARPALIAQVAAARQPSAGIRPEEIVLREELALTLVQKAVHKAYEIGNTIIIGRGGQILLKDFPDVFHVRVVAPLENRILRVKQEIKQSRQEYFADIESRRAAQDLIIERDTASADYIKQHYNVDWDDPLLYHLVLNTAKLSIDQAVKVISRLVNHI